jgi:Zn-dependent peptidase ImmA (M78 family)/DNA-binding Xre family transcriptional regulator
MKVIKLKSDQPEFNYKLITVAREHRGMGQKELAEKSGIDQGNISRIESGKQIPFKDTMEGIAKALNYRIDFFKQKSEVINFENSFYRRRFKIPKKDLLKAEACINVLKVNFDALLRMVDLVEPNYLKFDLETGETPQDCARKLREYWQLPHGYVPNLTELLERNGIVVIETDFEGIEKIDGFSIITENNVPIIFINKNLPADRYRLTLAHELGHIVLHLSYAISVLQLILEKRDVEEEAWAFAEEFMMPEREIKPDLMDVTIESLKEQKKYWQISMAALIMRAKKLGVISPNQYRWLWQKMIELGYKKEEPLEPEKEKPTILKDLIDTHLEDLEFDEKELAEFLGMKLEEFALKFLKDRPNLKVSFKGKT